MRLEINKLTYVVKGFLDALIPQSDSKLLPSGSDAINVDLFIDFISSNEHSKNLLYTAISRAKKKCIIIGDEDLFIKSQRKIDKKNNSLFMKLSDDFHL